MFERFTTDMRTVVMSAAQDAAARRGEARIGTDHLLIGVAAADNSVARGAGLSVDRLHDALDRLDERALGAIGVETDGAIVPKLWGWRRPRGHLPFTRGAKKSLERSLCIALDMGHRRITTDHLLAGLTVGGRNDRAVRLLRECLVEPADLEAAARAALRSRAS